MVGKRIVSLMMAFMVIILCLSIQLVGFAENEFQQNQQDRSKTAGNPQEVLAELKKAQERLMKWERQIAALNDEISLGKKNLTEKRKNLSRQEAQFNVVLVHMYQQSGKNQYLYYLLNADSVSEFLLRLDTLFLFLKHEKMAIQKYVDARNELEKEIALIEQKKEEKNALLKEAEREISRYIAMYEQNKPALASLGLDKEVEKALQLDKKQQVSIPDSPDIGVSKPPKVEDNLAWPQPGGKVITRFGNGYQGIRISNSIGSPIVAAASGVVLLTKSDFWGYGYYIVIDHGDGFKTLYANMYPSTVRVEPGDHVQKGQRIASVGNYALFSKPYLHFETHKNGKAVDPMQYY
ncbi:murein hydrolase activator EnvC family protein [Thermoactinomyces mirandus]|uniref:Peptidoglycan DD-metalloendopeptidase family protein n=1 Tax=Thermoactinomyces mirandus TaxID=2756294 RepID=A0A7W1XUX6_9BACL|nr:M23 family metallopeptidase [Thermoactinomyces mirandus]MBA4603512.1 peptidoglycan DD-metalloendopeptidase family protein [Thermoactinomyces mirandus]